MGVTRCCHTVWNCCKTGCSANGLHNLCFVQDYADGIPMNHSFAMSVGSGMRIFWTLYCYLKVEKGITTCKFQQFSLFRPTWQFVGLANRRILGSNIVMDGYFRRLIALPSPTNPERKLSVLGACGATVTSQKVRNFNSRGGQKFWKISPITPPKVWSLWSPASWIVSTGRAKKRSVYK